MNPPGRGPSKRRKRRIRSEAAAWVVRLHGPRRDVATEAALKKWLAEDDSHAAAFELATDVWEDTSGLTGPLLPRRRFTAFYIVAAAAVLLALGGTVAFFSSSRITTGADEVRTVTLADGTEVTLHAESRVVTHYDARQRAVTLKYGQALFLVKKHEPRPFVVFVGDRKVIATGTEFLVHRQDDSGAALAVTLIEGHVAVAPASAPDVVPVQTTPKVIVLNAGERVEFQGTAPPTVDRPVLVSVLGWLRGRLTFDHTPLADAVAEFNRYSRVRIVLLSPEAAKITVDGIFGTQDSLSFARAVASKNHLTLRVLADELILESAQPEHPGAKTAAN
jgi:transmembrane sensor